MKFRKKPVVIEAEQFTGQICGDPKAPKGICFASQDGCIGTNGHGYIEHIHTLEGPLRVSVGDWIITGVKGERYPCKPDIFEATYEAVE